MCRQLRTRATLDAFCRSIERHFTGSGETSILTERLPLVEGFNSRGNNPSLLALLTSREGLFKRVKDFKYEALPQRFPADYNMKDRIQTNFRIRLRLWFNPKWELLSVRCVTKRHFRWSDKRVVDESIYNKQQCTLFQMGLS